MSERVPFGNITRTRRTPRRRILVIAASDRPSNGCRCRVITTDFGRSWRWVVCRVFLKAPDIRIEHPVHPLPHDADVECIQRIMLAAPRSEPIGKPDEVLLVDRLQNCRDRLLDDLVSGQGPTSHSVSEICDRSPTSFNSGHGIDRLVKLRLRAEVREQFVIARAVNSACALSRGTGATACRPQESHSASYSWSWRGPCSNQCAPLGWTTRRRRIDHARLEARSSEGWR